MKVLVHTRTEYPDLAEKLGFEYRSLDDLLAQSDIVSLHVPGSPETAKMVNKSFLSKMKPDGVLLNTARGNVIVDDDLIAHLDASPAFWYGTDVFNGEPTTATADWSSAVSKHPRCYGTHHCGASTAQAENAIGAEALRVI
jgi:D-3-phosphoglycerate dehydrogenase